MPVGVATWVIGRSVEVEYASVDVDYTIPEPDEPVDDQRC